MDTGLKGRVALVAAASQGIGRAAAAALAAEGARVAICARNRETLQATANAIRQTYGAEVLAQAADVTDAGAVERLVSTVVERFGRLDICVANAGGPPAKQFLAVTAEEWQRAFELNLMSMVQLVRAAAPHMQRGGWGRVVAITSVSVRQPIADLVLSNTVRAGVMGLVKSLSNELGKDGITVNNVAPGYTSTERLKELAAVRGKALGITPEQMYERWAADVPLKRLARPEEVAAAIVFLASEVAGYITGQTLLVDGGAYKGL